MDGPPSNLTAVVVLAVFILCVVAGFVLALDRQLRGGLMTQREEAITRPDWVPLEALHPAVPKSFTLVIDPNYPERRSGLRSRRPGLSEDLVRQIHLLDGGVGGRTREVLMGPLLGVHYSPEEVLELFLNRVILGTTGEGAITGIYHAAAEYFGKPASEVSVSEAATLAAILLEPRIDRPADVPGAVGVRRNEILRALAEEGVISQEEYREALAEPLGFQPGLARIPMGLRIPSPADTIPVRLPAPPPPEASLR